MGLIAPSRQLARGENLVDPAAVEIDYFEAPTVLSELLADFGNPLHTIEHETGDGMKVAAFRQGDVQSIGEFLNRRVAGNEKGSVATRNDMFFRRAFFGAESADDRFEN